MGCMVDLGPRNLADLGLQLPAMLIRFRFGATPNCGVESVPKTLQSRAELVALHAVLIATA